MAKGIQPYVFLLLRLALVQGKKMPVFSLLADDIAQSNVPAIQVEFRDGAKDKLILWNHYFNMEDRLAPKTGRPDLGFPLQNNLLMKS